MNEVHGLSKRARQITGLTIALVAALAIGGTVYEQSQVSLTNPQQTFVSTTTSVVVVPIPGFPIESLILGILLGLIALSLIRSRKLGARKHSS